MFIGTAEAATEVEDAVVIFRRKDAKEFLLFLEAFADLRWVRFVGFCVSLVPLILDDFTIAITGIEGMDIYVGVHFFSHHTRTRTSVHLFSLSTDP